MPSIVILGAGAMGKLFGSRLAGAGIRIALVDTSTEIVAAIRRDGVTLVDDAGSSTARVEAGTAADVRGPADFVLVFTKSHHGAAALGAALHLLGPETCVVSLQNGIGNGERLRQVAPEARIAVGTTTWPADAAGPATVRTHGTGEVRFWSLDGADHPALHALNEALGAAGLAGCLDPDVSVTIWEKAIFNEVMNPVAALTRSTVGEMAACPAATDLAAAILAEALTIARACGVAVDAARIRATIAMAYREHTTHRPSMLNDVALGRRTEVAAINGALVAAARTAGVGAPVNETLARLVGILDSRAP